MAIPLEKADAEILIIAGEDDHNWDSVRCWTSCFLITFIYIFVEPSTDRCLAFSHWCLCSAMRRWQRLGVQKEQKNDFRLRLLCRSWDWMKSMRSHTTQFQTMPDLGHLVDLPFTPVATSIRCPRFNTNNFLSIEYQWLMKTFSTKYNSFMNTKTSKPFSLEPQSTNSQGTQFSHGVRLRCTWEEATTGQRQVGGKHSIFHR